VHAGGLGIVNLDAIHAEIAVAGVRVAGDDARQGDETATVQGPAFLDGEIEEGGRRCESGVGSAGRGINVGGIRPRLSAGGGGVEFVNDILAGAGLDGFGFGVAQVEGGAEELDGFAEAGGWPGFDERAEFRRRLRPRSQARG